MKTLLDTESDVGIRFRVKQLRATSEARWGKTNALKVLGHMIDILEAPVGESPSPRSQPSRLSGLLSFRPLRWLYLQSIPCTEGKSLVAPADITPAEMGAWGELVRRWYSACDQFVARGRSGSPFAPHPLFGPLSTEEWGLLVHFHTDYHLRQLGV